MGSERGVYVFCDRHEAQDSGQAHAFDAMTVVGLIVCGLGGRGFFCTYGW